jgi:hypothetical protein
MNSNKMIDVNVMKKWWNTTNQSDFLLCEIRKGTIEINGYQLFVSCGNRAFVGAKKGTEFITLFDCGAPDTPEDFLKCLRAHLES